MAKRTPKRDNGSPDATDGDPPEPQLGLAPTIQDFISGRTVRATPEEVDAVQVFSRRLVEDFAYPKSHIQTRPQFNVRRRPSEVTGSYPIDIAVFSSAKKNEADLHMIVECKRRNRKDGLEQLKIYMDLSNAEIGVWFNGEDHVYLRKVHDGGRRRFEEIPTIPRYGQRTEDIGKFRRCDLRRPTNLKAVFRDLRNHLAGNMTGITRDEALAQEIINILFCKIYDEINSGPDDIVEFRAGVNEKSTAVKKRIVNLFEKSVKAEYADVFSTRDSITLDPSSIVYIVGELQNFAIIEADRDAVGDAFEVFIGPALRGAEGQFFTPRNVVKMVVEMVAPKPGERIIDPACGSGGFLIASLEYVWNQLAIEGKNKRWSASILEKKKADAATKNFRGLDKDSFLAKVTKSYMAIMGDGRGGVFCENALVPPDEWEPMTREQIQLGTFDIVMTNPPFGKKIKIKGESTLSQYDLAHKWKRTGDDLERTSEVLSEQAPHILFIERCCQLLKEGGRLGIVMPESVIGSPSYRNVISHLMSRMSLRAVVALPEALFKTSGKGGTHTKVCVLVFENTLPRATYRIFMSDVKWCGHDSRGNPTMRIDQNGSKTLLDEVPTVSSLYRNFVAAGQVKEPARLGFSVKSDDITDCVLVPKYYDPELEAYIRELGKTHKLVRLGDLVDDGTISLATGTEIGKMAYGTGKIPFVRTSDFSNWEIKADFKHGVSPEIYRQHSESCDVTAGDILFVKDGTYLIGATAIVTESDLPMLFQSHIYRIRVLDNNVINPWLLFAALNSPVVRRQVRAKQFTQDIIDTIGRRVTEIYIPLPRSSEEAARIATEIQVVVETRVRLRNEATKLSYAVEGLEPASRSPDDE